ncbi:MAG: acyl-CoA dehydrogenase C-terminal domain-containing protein [Myxococcota bacterium]
MQTYRAPVKDMRFQLETFGYDELLKLPKFSAFDMETATALMEQTASFMTESLLPLNRTGDVQGLKWDPETGGVTMPEGFKQAYMSLVENGQMSIAGPEQYGGGGAPESLGVLIGEMMTACNKSLSMCPGLTRGLVEALDAHGTDEQKEAWLPKLVSGEWSGTMCLTEPQCGTDLGLIRSKAVPEGDAYRISGTKIWITFGEHDMTENIVHLVLARLPDAPEGIKGISCFIVPKKTLDGKANGVKCVGLEHKMGIHASPTCVIELENSIGYLVGEPHKGMRSMFVMMNAARLHVGVEGVALSEISYQTALAFAKDRRQSRSLDPAKREDGTAADNILVHPDVRRMLLNVKSSVEGMRALATWVGVNLDLSHHAEGEVKETAADLVALLTPVVKSYCTEQGFDNISEAMQVCGGAGFTTDWSIEQYMRDARIAMIYEGTNHIQALDLVGRKLPMKGGQLVRVFASQITDLIRACADDPLMGEFIEPLKAVSNDLTETTMMLAERGMQDPEEAAAVASNYLNLFAYCAMAYVWARQAKAALDQDSAFHRAKVKTARYFMNNVLPRYRGLLPLIQAGKVNMMEFEVEELEVA